MADFFGDSSLFEEFERDRDTESSYIHYEEDNVRSRIVFESYDSESARSSESEEESEEQSGAGQTITASATIEETETEKENPSESACPDNADNGTDMDTASKSETNGGISEKTVEEKTDSPSVESSDNAKQKPDNIQNQTESGVASSTKSSKSSGTESKRKDTSPDETTWLIEQLHAEAEKEAKEGNVNVQQLVFEKNKLKRFAKIMDSTRCVPDEDSPAVQLLFNNNGFARKYRQQIEQFIKGLIWEEYHTNRSQESVAEISSKPGAPSCIELNDTLPPSKRTETMRQRHTLLGNSQFHRQFLIDFLGWPFTTKEPTRCNQNWEIPLYGQVFDAVYADPTISKKPPQKKNKPSCWNCGEENHSVADCKQPRNPANIAANRKLFMEQQPKRSEPKFTGPNRYHLDSEIASRFNKFSPGVISDGLREALGLNPDQLPMHIYKMRLFGYPPGWLDRAKQVQSGVSIFDKTGRVTLITGECLEDGELDDETAKGKNEFDVNKIIEYPGFTVPVPLGFVDEHADNKMPPIQNHQLKETLKRENPEKPRKRKREADQEEKSKEEEEAKKPKESASGVKAQEEEVDEGETSVQTEEGETSVQTEEGETSVQTEEGETSVQTEEGETSVQTEEGETSVQTEEGETWSKPENWDTSPKLEEGDASPKVEEESETPDTQPMEEDEAQQEEMSPVANKTPLLNKSSSTISISRDFGTPILVREKSDLPDASKFSVGIEDHINFENLPNSTGVFEKMRNLMGIIRKKSKK